MFTSLNASFLYSYDMGNTTSGVNSATVSNLNTSGSKSGVSLSITGSGTSTQGGLTCINFFF